MNNKINPIIEQAKKEKEDTLSLNYNLDQFLKKLNKKPQNVAKNTQQGNYEYLPISHVLNMLNQVFLGRFQTKNFQWSPLHTQLIGSIDLHFYHPITKEWMQHVGTAATQIRCNRNNGEPIKNGLSMDVPRLKADCIKNAAKSLGKVFGADLNRKIEDHYRTHYSDHIDKQSYSVEEVREKLKTINNQSDFIKYYTSNPFFDRDPNISKMFEEKQRDLNDTTFSR